MQACGASHRRPLPCSFVAKPCRLRRSRDTPLHEDRDELGYAHRRVRGNFPFDLRHDDRSVDVFAKPCLQRSHDHITSQRCASSDRAGREVLARDCRVGAPSGRRSAISVPRPSAIDLSLPRLLSVATGPVESLSAFGSRDRLQVGRGSRCLRRCRRPEWSEQVEGMLRRDREVDVLAAVVNEAREQRGRSEPAQLLPVGGGGKKGHDVTDRDQRFRPRCRTAAEREHVVHPHAVTARPPRLARPATSYLHVSGAVPKCPIAQHQD